MFAEARVDDYYAVVRKRAASLLCRIRASSNSLLKVLADRFDVPALNCCAGKCKSTSDTTFTERRSPLQDSSAPSTIGPAAEVTGPLICSTGWRPPLV
ncbi:hypothetical protein K1T71_002236 [Dendrolimus kikuchii]|uniref:Uncharacterized protein n=1 Tax=Dendrolimus kikuchii TaxID=765133 RepID=A0ACC1DG62_9NEOP|nr:hypothetical protein K1T71_002236 [Dendrolimus kikuchii]